MEARLAEVERKGHLKFFNEQHRAQRLAERETGAKVLPYRVAKLRLRRAITGKLWATHAA